VVAGVLVLEVAIIFAAIVIPINQSTAQGISQSVSGICPLGGPPLPIMRCLFSHNLLIALIETVPVLGAFLFFDSAFLTGQATQAIALSHAAPPTLYGALLFLFPHTIVELSAYALAVASGSMLIVAAGRKRLRKEARVFVFELVGIALILLLAAAIETATIETGALSLILWLPVCLLIAWLTIALRRTTRRTTAPSPPSPAGIGT
jgi:uncharacterized membrane protein SpoIIM required for sporulation